MATNVAKAYYADDPVMALDNPASEGPIEVEVLDAGATPQQAEESQEQADEFNKNLAEVIDAQVLVTIAAELVADINEDINSRKDWEVMYQKGIDLLGLKIEERTEPWNGACGVYHPILAEAAVRFQAETIMETFPASGPVKTKILGKITKEKEESASRVREDMNYQLTETMSDYRAEHERLLWALPIAGSAFKKVYFDPSLNRQTAMFIPAEDLVVPYGASTLESAQRVTHRMKKTKNDLLKLQASGFYKDDDLGDPVPETTLLEQRKNKTTGMEALKDNRYTLYECHVDYDLPGYEDKKEDGEDSGIGRPYVITINLSTKKILSVYRNWRPDDVQKNKRLHFVHYGYIPGFGFYNFGLVHLVGGFAKSATSLLRQLVDAGTLANLPGGLKTRGLRIKGDDTPIRPGEWRDVDIAGGKIQENLMALPYKEPSVVLKDLLLFIVEEGRKFISMADVKASDMSAEAPVGTTLALLERQLKIMSAVQARVHTAMKTEFKLLKEIIRDNTPGVYTYDPDGDDNPDRKVKQADYDLCEVIPVSDPNASTMSQRIVQYQAAFQLAAASPQIYDQPELHAQMLGVLGFKNIGKLIPTHEDMKPKDPVSENMAILVGKPVKAYLNQDHQAHIQSHMAAAQDPQIAQLVGQSPQAPAIQAAFAAHVTEHVAMKYRKDMEMTMGVPLPDPDAILPEDIEVQLSRTIAEAADKLLARDRAIAAAVQAQQQAQDPLVEIQRREVAVKEGDLSRKQQKDQTDASLKNKELDIKAQDGTEKRGLQDRKQVTDAHFKAADTVLKNQQQESADHQTGMKMGTDISKLHKQHAHEKELKQQDTANQQNVKTADIAHQQHMRGADFIQQAADHQQQNQQQAMDHEQETKHKIIDQAHEHSVKDKELAAQKEQAKEAAKQKAKEKPKAKPKK